MSTQVALLPVKAGTISDQDKAALREVGVIVVEHEAPETLRLLTPTAELETSDLLGAAMWALTGSHASTAAQAAFTLYVGRLIADKRKAKAAATPPPSA